MRYFLVISLPFLLKAASENKMIPLSNTIEEVPSQHNARPALTRSQGCTDLRIEVLDEDRLCQTLIDHYFQGQYSPSRAVEHQVRTRLRHLADSDSEEDRDAYHLVQQFAYYPEQYEMDTVINRIVISALSDALNQTEQRERSRWTKKESAVLAAITALVTTALTSAVALLITYV